MVKKDKRYETKKEYRNNKSLEKRKFIIKSIIKIILEIVKKKKKENYIMHYLQW